jgi:hypothetical protein
MGYKIILKSRHIPQHVPANSITKIENSRKMLVD